MSDSLVKLMFFGLSPFYRIRGDCFRSKPKAGGPLCPQDVVLF